MSRGRHFVDDDVIVSPRIGATQAIVEFIVETSSRLGESTCAMY